MRADILALFLTLRGSIQSLTIEYEVSCRVFVDVVYQVEEVSFYF